MSDARPAPRLPGDTVVRFVGDLHLGDGAHNDGFGDSDDALAAFLATCPGSCEAVVFMGDTFDLPQALGLRRVLRRHARAVDAIDALSRRQPVYFVRGNHDWRVDFEALFPAAVACERLHVGDTLVWHGHRLDRFCHPDRRLHTLQTALHHVAERLFRFHFRLPLSRYDTWQNRAAHWLGIHYGRHLGRKAALYRALGLRRRAEEAEAFIAYWSRALWGDAQGLFEPARDWLAGSEHAAMVCGHTHLPGSVRFDSGHAYVNAGSWAFGARQHASWDGRRFEVRDDDGEPIGDRHYRWMLDGQEPGDFRAWWAGRHSDRSVI